MTLTWTGRPGEPVPVALRHTPRVTYTEAPGGIAIWTCAGCDASAFVPVGEEPEKMNVSLCGVAVAQRLAELEAHEASIHKAAARARRGVVRWLRAAADDALALAPPGRRKSGLRNHAATITAVADDIDSGAYAEWCEANPEIPPAPVGADAGRDPGSKDSR